MPIMMRTNQLHQSSCYYSSRRLTAFGLFLFISAVLINFAEGWNEVNVDNNEIDNNEVGGNVNMFQQQGEDAELQLMVDNSDATVELLLDNQVQMEEQPAMDLALDNQVLVEQRAKDNNNEQNNNNRENNKDKEDKNKDKNKDEKEEEENVTPPSAVPLQPVEAPATQPATMPTRIQTEAETTAETQELPEVEGVEIVEAPENEEEEEETQEEDQSNVASPAIEQAAEPVSSPTTPLETFLQVEKEEEEEKAQEQAAEAAAANNNNNNNNNKDNNQKDKDKENKNDDKEEEFTIPSWQEVQFNNANAEIHLRFSLFSDKSKIAASDILSGATDTPISEGVLEALTYVLCEDNNNNNHKCIIREDMVQSVQEKELETQILANQKNNGGGRRKQRQRTLRNRIRGSSLQRQQQPQLHFEQQEKISSTSSSTTTSSSSSSSGLRSRSLEVVTQSILKQPPNMHVVDRITEDGLSWTGWKLSYEIEQVGLQFRKLAYNATLSPEQYHQAAVSEMEYILSLALRQLILSYSSDNNRMTNDFTSLVQDTTEDTSLHVSLVGNEQQDFAALFISSLNKEAEQNVENNILQEVLEEVEEQNNGSGTQTKESKGNNNKNKEKEVEDNEDVAFEQEPVVESNGQEEQKPEKMQHIQDMKDSEELVEEIEGEGDTQDDDSYRYNNVTGITQGINPHPLHALRIVGIVMLALTLISLTLLIHVASKRKKQRELDEKRIQDGAPGLLITPQGVDEILTKSATNGTNNTSSGSSNNSAGAAQQPNNNDSGGVHIQLPNSLRV